MPSHATNAFAYTDACLYCSTMALSLGMIVSKVCVRLHTLPRSIVSPRGQGYAEFKIRNQSLPPPPIAEYIRAKFDHLRRSTSPTNTRASVAKQHLRASFTTFVATDGTRVGRSLGQKNPAIPPRAGVVQYACAVNCCGSDHGRHYHECAPSCSTESSCGTSFCA